MQAQRVYTGDYHPQPDTKLAAIDEQGLVQVLLGYNKRLSLRWVGGEGRVGVGGERGVKLTLTAAGGKQRTQHTLTHTHVHTHTAETRPARMTDTVYLTTCFTM